MKRPLDITGQKYGRLTAIRHVGVVNRKHRWLCVCDCGQETVVGIIDLRNGNTKSCGCLRREMTKLRGEQRFKHGHKKNNTPTYVSWTAMRCRCKSKSVRSYGSYLARGIKVCERWKEFANFLADMGERPLGTSIDRIDNNGNYEPANCRWATKKEQARNRRNNVFVEHDGKQITLIEYREVIGAKHCPTHLRASHRAGK